MSTLAYAFVDIIIIGLTICAYTFCGMWYLSNTSHLHYIKLEVFLKHLKLWWRQILSSYHRPKGLMIQSLCICIPTHYYIYVTHMARFHFWKKKNNSCHCLAFLFQTVFHLKRKQQQTGLRFSAQGATFFFALWLKIEIQRNITFILYFTNRRFIDFITHINWYIHCLSIFAFWMWSFLLPLLCGF